MTSIERKTPTTSPTNANTLTWRVTFNEDVKDVGYADFAIAGTTAGLTATAMTGSASVYDVTASGGNLADRNATVTLSFATGQDIKDIANNNLTDTAPTGTNDFTFVVDNTAPTVTITDVPTDSTGAFPATFTFNEAVNDFVVGDITVGNGTASNLQNPSSDNQTFTATITPVSSGDVTLNVAANAAEDAAGNGNTAATQVSSAYMAPVTDTTAPRVTSIEYYSDYRTQVSPTNGDEVQWLVTFNEDVKNVDATDFEVSNTSAMPSATDFGPSQYIVEASGGDLADLDATVTLSFASGQNIQDLASNDLTNTMPTGTNDNMILVDNTAPTVTITDVPMDSTGAFTATFTFNEAVNDFIVGDITVGNGTAAAFTGINGDTTFTAEITPASTGTVTVDVAANTATDAAGNGNTAAIQVSSAYTYTEPVIATLPDAPTGLMANPEDAQVTLNWTVGADGGSAIIKHRIRWKEGSGFYAGWTDIPNSAPSETNATSYTVTGLTNGTAYTFQVRAENGEGESIAPHATSSQVTPSATDTTAPRVTSIERQTPTTSPTNADTLTWRVTFNEDVKDVGYADFAIAGTTAGLTVTAMTGSASVYDVMASGGDLADLDATVTLSFASGQDIKDIANNNADGHRRRRGRTTSPSWWTTPPRR